MNISLAEGWTPPRLGLQRVESVLSNSGHVPMRTAYLHAVSLRVVHDIRQDELDIGHDYEDSDEDLEPVFFLSLLHLLFQKLQQARTGRE